MKLCYLMGVKTLVAYELKFLTLVILFHNEVNFPQAFEGEEFHLPTHLTLSGPAIPTGEICPVPE